MKVGLISDTHGFLDPAVATDFAECDEIWHAGDVGSIAVLEGLRAIRTVRAVYGNVDGAQLRSMLDGDLEWDCEGVRVYMTHIGGYPGRYDRRARKELAQRKPGLFICGHSHILRVMRDQALGLVHMNPGAAGKQGWHKVRTLLRFTVAAATVSCVEVVELVPR